MPSGRPAALIKLQQQQLSRLSSRCTTTTAASGPSQDAGSTQAQSPLHGSRDPPVQIGMQPEKAANRTQRSQLPSQGRRALPAQPTCSNSSTQPCQGPQQQQQQQQQQRPKMKTTTVSGMMTRPPSRNSSSSQPHQQTVIATSDSVRVPLAERQLLPQQQQQQQGPHVQAPSNLQQQPMRHQYHRKPPPGQQQQQRQQKQHPPASRTMPAKTQPVPSGVLLAIPSLSMPPLAVTGHQIPAPWSCMDPSKDAGETQPDVMQRSRQDQSLEQAVAEEAVAPTTGTAAGFVRFAADVVSTSAAAVEKSDGGLYAAARGHHERVLKRAGTYPCGSLKLILTSSGDSEKFYLLSFTYNWVCWPQHKSIDNEGACYVIWQVEHQLPTAQHSRRDCTHATGGVLEVACIGGRTACLPCYLHYRYSCSHQGLLRFASGFAACTAGWEVPASMS